MYVFVYGTLMQGYNAHHYLKDAEFVGKASTVGKLYNLGWFPGLKDGPGTVHGELYLVKPEVAELLDDYEGYRYGDTASLYVREVRTVHVAPDKVYYAQTYLINRDVSDCKCIESGNWHDRGVRDDEDEMGYEDDLELEDW